MRRALLIWCLLLAGVVCVAQSEHVSAFWQSRDSNYNQNIVSGGFTPTCSQSSTFLAAASGVALTADKTKYDTLICGLNTDGNLSNMCAGYVFAAPTTTNAALINITNPGTFNGTVHGTPTSFTAYLGYTGDGATFYIDTGLTPSTASCFTATSAAIGLYVNNNRTSGSGDDMGSNFNSLTIVNLYQFGQYSIFLNGGGTPISGSSSGTQGAWNVVRSLTTESLYQNSNETAIATATDVAGSLDNGSIYIFAINGGGSAAGFATETIQAAWIMNGSISATNSCKINNRFNTFMTAYANNVYSNSAC